MTVDKSPADTSVIPPDATQKRFARALSLWAGQSRQWSVTDLSIASGVSERSIRAYRSDERCPSLEHALSIAAVLGARFTSYWLALANQGAHDLPDDDDGASDIVAALDEVTQDVRHHAPNGRINHRAAAHLAQVSGPRLVAIGGGMMRRAS